jgi:geranylgeranyl diphosphate synthase type I
MTAMTSQPRKPLVEGDYYLKVVQADYAKSSAVQEKHLASWLRWHGDAQGKWLRARLAVATGELLGLSTQTYTKWAVVCELIHSASLVHDDICDQDSVRRGKISLWREFGIPAAICTGDFLIAEASRKLAEIEQVWDQSILLKLLACTVQETVYGQSQDITYRLTKISWDIYRNIATQKTAPLISLPMMGIFKCAKLDQSQCESLSNIASNIGFAYQLLNDLENILLENDKTLPTDLLYGRTNGIVVQFLLTASSAEAALLREKNIHVLSLFFAKGIIANCFNLIAESLNQADDNNHELPIEVRPILLSISDEVRNRAKILRNNRVIRR